MYHLFESNRVIEFKKWLGTSLPSANDNNDPDHDCSVNAADPRGKTGAGAIRLRSAAWANPLGKAWIIRHFG